MSNALDPGDAVFFINDWVESLDLQVFEVRYTVMGEHSYPPRVVLKLWLFGAIEGVPHGVAYCYSACLAEGRCEHFSAGWCQELQQANSTADGRYRA